MLLPLWSIVIVGAIVLQVLTGVALLIVGLAMMRGQHHAGGSESRWPLGRKLAAIGGVLLAIAGCQFMGLVLVFFVWASTERFA